MAQFLRHHVHAFLSISHQANKYNVSPCLLSSPHSPSPAVLETVVDRYSSSTAPITKDACVNTDLITGNVHCSDLFSDLNIVTRSVNRGSQTCGLNMRTENSRLQSVHASQLKCQHSDDISFQKSRHETILL